MRTQLLKKIPLFIIVFVSLFGINNIKAQQRPLLTEEADTIAIGQMRAQLGFEFLNNQRFGLSGLRGDLVKAGIVGLHFGVASNVSFSIEGTTRNFLDITKTGYSFTPLSISSRAESTNDVGDFTLATKIRLHKEGIVAPSISFRLAATLPNSDQSKGIGTNTTNVLASAHLGKTFLGGQVKTFGNLGIGILSGTQQSGSQQDVLIYGVASIVKLTEQLSLVGEVSGRHNPRHPQPGLESQSQVRLGIQVPFGPVKWDVAALAGLTRFSPRVGVSVGISYDFHLFK